MTRKKNRRTTENQWLTCLQLTGGRTTSRHASVTKSHITTYNYSDNCSTRKTTASKHNREESEEEGNEGPNTTAHGFLYAARDTQNEAIL